MKTFKLLSLLFFTFLIVNCTSNSDEGDCTECSYTVASGETAGTVPSTLDGEYNLTYRFPQTDHHLQTEQQPHLQYLTTF